ncbi:hypothetical protein [Aeromonas schubertii]|uniref:Uncharacterized protein n=1 Tax=Aeromonas schubertii TaxID=652 RepID=A0A0S2SD90_9GAMM|nr:hypothetical protein [Aeromonas schubertii]ALP39685.1 hypothetical protein WL1483_266 [Aeromonas schubertii]KUE80023.1 hypothetical protein ATO46_17085 [Aeromonas schubertii]MBZ6067498.1 hypothetical protein [Aeromonas schubertii]MBZ6074468.1 hypothetical protein [Aeromonas schubertii]
MELERDPRCYTDLCIDGKWYHYDHCTTRVYMLMGGASPRLELPREPRDEEELLLLLKALIAR